MICTHGRVIIKFQDEHSGVVFNTSANLTQISNGDKSIVANFFNLTENMLYQPSVSVYNNGMMLLESNHVDTTQVDASKCYYLLHYSHFHHLYKYSQAHLMSLEWTIPYTLE